MQGKDRKLNKKVRIISLMNKNELRKAFYEGLITEEQFKDELFKIENAPKVKPKKKLPVALTEDEFDKLLSHTLKEKFKFIFILGGEAGLRLSEIAGGIRSDGTQINPLTKEKIDILQRTIRIEDAKGHKDRIVPIPRNFRNSYLKYLPVTQDYSNILSARRSIEKVFKLTCKRAGLLQIKPNLHFHSLRHFFGTHLANSGMPLHHLRTLLGHSNISTTNVYLQSSPKEALLDYEKRF